MLEKRVKKVTAICISPDFCFFSLEVDIQVNAMPSKWQHCASEVNAKLIHYPKKWLFSRHLSTQVTVVPRGVFNTPYQYSTRCWCCQKTMLLHVQMLSLQLGTHGRTQPFHLQTDIDPAAAAELQGGLGSRSAPETGIERKEKIILKIPLN